MTDETDPTPATVTMTGLDAPREDHLMRMELVVEVAAPPEVVWQAIATGPGLSMWFLETELEERVGGHVAFHMGPEMASEGEVTAWEPGTRLEYAEPGWCDLAGRENTGQQPLVSEFLIEATSGGTSILRVVSSAYGTGAEWEREWFADMVANWAPSFDTFARYVARHAGEPGARLDAQLPIEGGAHEGWTSVIELLGSPSVGDLVRFGDVEGTLERLTNEHNVKDLLVSFDGAVRGFGVMAAYEIGDGVGIITLGGSLFGAEADQQVEQLQEAWSSTLAPIAAS